MDSTEKLRKLDPLGAIGAGILGAGVALLFAKWLLPYAIPALLVGILAHGWAMFAKARLARMAHEARPQWAAVAEGIC